MMKLCLVITDFPISMLLWYIEYIIIIAISSPLSESRDDWLLSGGCVSRWWATVSIPSSDNTSLLSSINIRSASYSWKMNYFSSAMLLVISKVYGLEAQQRDYFIFELVGKSHVHHQSILCNYYKDGSLIAGKMLLLISSISTGA